MLLRKMPRRSTALAVPVVAPNTAATPLHLPGPPASTVFEWTSTSLPPVATRMEKPYACAVVAPLPHAAPRSRLFSTRPELLSASTPVVARVPQPPVMLLRSTNVPPPFTHSPTASPPRLPLMTLLATRPQLPPSHMTPNDCVGWLLPAPWISLLPMT